MMNTTQAVCCCRLLAQDRLSNQKTGMMSAPTTPGPPPQGPPYQLHQPWAVSPEDTLGLVEKPLVDFLDMMRSVPKSSYCYQLQDPMEVHKTLKAKMTIHQNEMDVKKFT